MGGFEFFLKFIKKKYKFAYILNLYFMLNSGLKKIVREYNKIMSLKKNSIVPKIQNKEVYFEKFSMYNKFYKIEPTLNSHILKEK